MTEPVSNEDLLKAFHDGFAKLDSKVVSAFPSGDVDGHRRFHETQILLLDERRKLVAAIKEKTISGLVWAGIIAMGSALWAYLKDHLR